MSKNTLPTENQNSVKDSRENINQESGNMTESGQQPSDVAPSLRDVLAAVKSSITNSPIVRYKTRNMDRAAFFMTLGAEIVELEEKYPHNVFVLDLPKWMFAWEKYVGFIRYRTFCENRKVLKKMGRKQAGLPEYFTGINNGYKLEDIATFRSFNKRGS